VSEEKANQRVEEFKREMKTLSIKLKEAEQRAEHAEKQVKRLQKEVDRLEGMYPTSYAPGTFTQPFSAEVSLHGTPEMLSTGSDPPRTAGSLASTNARIVFIAIRILIIVLSTLLSLIDVPHSHISLARPFF